VESAHFSSFSVQSIRWSKSCLASVFSDVSVLRYLQAVPCHVAENQAALIPGSADSCFLEPTSITATDRYYVVNRLFNAFLRNRTQSVLIITFFMHLYNLRRCASYYVNMSVAKGYGPQTGLKL
jgi:hypothetical protein